MHSKAPIRHFFDRNINRNETNRIKHDHVIFTNFNLKHTSTRNKFLDFLFNLY
jgi:hypothetical protein